MATRPKKSSGKLTETGTDRPSKGKQESEFSICLQSSKFESSNAGHSDGSEKARRKAQQPCKYKNNSASNIHDTADSISTTGEFSGKRTAKNKNEEICQQASGPSTTNPRLSTKSKETTSKYCSSKSLEKNDLGMPLERTNVTKKPVESDDKIQHSLVMNGHCYQKAPKETDSRQWRRSKSSETTSDLAINLDQTNSSNKKQSPAEPSNTDNSREHCIVNNVPRRKNSKINEDTANSARDRGEIRRQANRSNSLPNPNLSKHLRDAVKNLKMKMDDISSAAEKVNKVIDIIIKSDITKSNSLFKSMEILSTGSYYERVKISRPNEFDIMLKISFESYQTIQLTSIDESGAFYTLAFKRQTPPAMAPYIDEDRNILAKYILDEFRRLVNSILQQSGKLALLEKKDPSSPAVTLSIPNEPENISVDLVLALLIRQWPEKANDGMNIENWLGTKEKQKYRKEPCYMVSKRGKKDKKDTWRISFSNIEKDIITHHGSAKTCCERKSPKCCRKPCLKLMKYLLEQFKKSGNERKMNQFCSYHAKTALLHMCTHFPKDEDWKLEDLDVCFNRYVEFFQECLKKCFLSNFFIPSHNLFSSDYIDKSSCNYLFEELESEKTQNYPILNRTWLSTDTPRLPLDYRADQNQD